MAITKEWHNYTGTWSEGQHLTDPTKDLLIILPDGYDSGTIYPWIFLNHSRGGSAHQWDGSGTTHSDFANWWAANGYVVVGAMCGNDSHWGNDAALTNIEASREKAISLCSLRSKATLGGSSMGGIPSLLLLKNHPTWWDKCVLLYPVSDLDAVHTPEAGNSNYQTSINTAYSCNNDTYEAATEGHAPEDHYIDYAAAGVPLRVYHGDNDTLISPTQSTNLRDGVNALKDGLLTLVTVAGTTHGSYSVYTQFASDIGSWLAQINMNDLDLQPIRSQYDLELVPLGIASPSLSLGCNF